MKAAIFYSKFFDHDGEQLHIGGIETYLINLGKLCNRMGIKPIIFQPAKIGFSRDFEEITVIGIPGARIHRIWKANKLFKKASEYFDQTKDIVIFGTDRLSVRYGSGRCVAIQHGIAWDQPNRLLFRGKVPEAGLAGKWRKLNARYQAIKSFERCPNRVCVDYNFLNWYRTYICHELSGNNWVIPNFAHIPDKGILSSSRKHDTTVKILFARRFIECRGTRIMAEAAEGLLKRHPTICFTFAGEGRDEAWLRSKFVGEPRVVFMKYLQEQVTDVHLQHHIAVVPSLASEGTSLSVAEAMACGCAVAATPIGGVTNMIIDGYNGKFCAPSSKELEDCLHELITNEDQRARIAARGYETAKNAFSKEKWETSWSQVIEEIAKM